MATLGVMDADDAEWFWDDLLDYIEEKRVIPILGPELLQIEGPEGSATLYERIAARLAERMRVPRERLPEPFSLNDVVCAHLDQGGRREELYLRVRSVLKELGMTPPRAMTQLARIKAFDLFVTLTFDSLMAEAINAERYGGRPMTQELAYSPMSVSDLASDREAFTAPVVYHLLGKVSASPEYVISDEDLLEWVSALQSETRRPVRLFDELKGSHLLLIGCPFSNWLAQFFLRVTKGRPLSLQRGETEILVSQTAARDPSLSAFLRHFSYATKVWPTGAPEFVDELARRWQERHPEAAPAVAAAGDPAPAARAETDDFMIPGSVFISYAHEDEAAVLRLKGGLEAHGLDVWFDRRRLDAGDAWDLKIRRNINACSLFLPVVSANTERRTEGYFRKEWRWAEERAQGIAEGVPFLIPVAIDATLEATAAKVPIGFHRVQWVTLPDGEPAPDFCARLVQLVRNYRRQERAGA
jgi:hypothetical protein